MQPRPIALVPTLLTVMALASPTPGLAQQTTTVPIPPARLGASGPEGLFSRVVVDFSSGNVDVRTLLFLPGNGIVRTFPFGGAATFDLTRCNPDMCGIYQLAGDRMAIRWADGRADQWSYGMSADGAVDLDGDRYRPARVVSSPELVGSWADAGGNTYVFAGNGTFSFGYGGSGLSGRYALQGLALTLTFQDGDTRIRTVFAAGSGDPVGMLSIDGDAYRRR
jgi:hypothetical protein